MKFTFYHNNINVLDLEKSVEFYKKALGLTITKEHEAEDGSFKLVFMGDGATPHLLELTWLHLLYQRSRRILDRDLPCCLITVQAAFYLFNRYRFACTAESIV